MPTYNPILKAKPGELSAWRQADLAVLSNTRPLFEVVPNHGLDRDLSLAVNQLSTGWPAAAHAATVDTGFLDQTVPVAGTGVGAVLWTAEQLLLAGVPARPVIRIDDPPAILAEAAAADRLHKQGVCLRLGEARTTTLTWMRRRRSSTTC